VLRLFGVETSLLVNLINSLGLVNIKTHPFKGCGITSI
jgi:hypothetical protein